MSWFAQVRHVMMKDVRQSWWPLAGYTIVAALGTLYIVLGPVASDLYVSAMVMSTMLGVVLCALLLQADSPTRSNAFWASRPFHPSAIIATKLALTAFAVIGIPAVGEIIGLLSLRTPHGALASIVGGSAGVYAIWLLAAILLAALTDDLRSFVTAAVIIAVVLLLIMAMLPDSVTGPLDRNWVSHALATVGGIGALSIVALVYRRRTVRRTVWLGGFVAIACLMLSLVGTGSDSRIVDRFGSMPVHISVDTATLRNLGELRLTVRVDSPLRSLRLRFSIDTLDIRLADGSRIYLHPTSPAASVQDPALPLPNLARWLGDTAALTEGFPRNSIVPVQLGDDDRSRLSAGVQAVEAVGHIDASEPRLVTTIPLTQGATWTGNGTRFRITNVATHTLATDVTLNTLGISPRAGDWSGYNYVAWNETRREAMMFGKLSSGSSSGWVLVPGSTLLTTTAQMQAAARRGQTFDLSVNDAWFSGARLAVFEWVPRGRFATRAVVAVAQH